MIIFIKDLLKKHFAFGFNSSSNRSVYEEIARKLDMKPRTVYRLAHGKRIADQEERAAMAELFRVGLIGHR